MAFTMSIDKILQIIKSKCVNEFYTDRYVKFIYDCIASNQHLSSDIYTENHHILPKSKNFWPEYKSFSKHPWNKSVLTARQHFIAHWMLSKALGGVMWYALKCLRPKDWQMGEEQKEKLSKQVSNTIWITDGNVSKRIQQSDDIPEGFIRGRKRKSR